MPMRGGVGEYGNAMVQHAAPVSPLPGFLRDGGECAALIAAHDWSATLGPPARWPMHLRTAVGIMLRSPAAMVILWGDDGIMLYNDAYGAIAGVRHPGLLGLPVREAWPEVADFNDHVMQVCLGGGTLAFTDQQMILDRDGGPQVAWFDLSYSPILDDAGRPAGVLAVVAEASSRVLAHSLARGSDIKLQAAVDQMPVGIALADAETGAVFHMNRAGAAIIGSDSMPPGIADYVQLGAVHADGRPYRAEDYPLARAALNGEVIRGEPMQLRRPDGRLIRLEVNASRVHDDGGRPVMAVCAFADVTQRHEAEQLLRENESRLLRAYEAGGIGSYEWDMVDGGGVQSDSMLRLAGLAPGRNYRLREILATVHPDDLDRVMHTVAAIGKGADRMETDYRVCLPDGSVRWLRDFGQLERDASGRPLRWVGVVQDVTERSLAECRLRENEERLRLATTAAQMGTWDFDIRANSGKWDDAALAVCGIAGQDPHFTGQSGSRIVHADDRARVDGAFAACIKTRQDNYDVEFRAAMPAADGRERWMTCHGIIIRDDAGQPVRAVGILRDVTTRQRELERLRHSEEALRRSEEQLRLSLAAGRMVAWEIDSPSGLMRRSSATDDILGPGESTEDIRARMPPEDAARARAAAERAFAQPDTPYDVEFRYRHPDGRDLWMHNRGVVLRDANGRAASAYGVCMDITARKTAELALRELNERLESEVERRTEQLLQAQDALRQSQKMEALGQLTGGVAHDFNNLLGAVVGSLDIIRRAANNPDKIRRFAELGLAAADRGAKLTGQLLAFSRAQRIELKPIDVSALVLGMQDMLARSLGPMIELSLEVSPHAIVKSDSIQLELALLNLAINSRDAMPGGGRLTIACQPRTLAGDIQLPAGDYIDLSVTDTGGGMAPDVAARAFDPFFTTKALGKGTGLGLSQVHGIVRQCGGDVRIETRPGAGTTVRLLLPRSQADGPRPAPADRLDSLRRWSGTALVIDDDPGIRDTLAGCLELLGLDAVFEADGAAGLARLAAMTPRVLILDYAMPGLTGADVASRVRALQPDLPIIFCTGYSDSQLIERAAGSAVVVLRKPFRLDDLANAISTALAPGAPPSG